MRSWEKYRKWLPKRNRLCEKRETYIRSLKLLVMAISDCLSSEEFKDAFPSRDFFQTGNIKCPQETGEPRTELLWFSCVFFSLQPHGFYKTQMCLWIYMYAPLSMGEWVCVRARVRERSVEYEKAPSLISHNPELCHQEDDYFSSRVLLYIPSLFYLWGNESKKMRREVRHQGERRTRKVFTFRWGHAVLFSHRLSVTATTTISWVLTVMLGKHFVCINSSSTAASVLNEGGHGDA